MSIVLRISKGLKQIASWELDNCAKGLVPKSVDCESKHYNVHIDERNSKASEAIALTESISPLMQLRAHIFRGSFSEAETLITQILDDPNLKQHLEVATEIILEQARIKALEGAYDECIKLSTIALGMAPSAVTKATLFQVRALAAYELGQFQSALKDLDLVDSLSSLLPYANASFYSKVLRIKIEAICQSPKAARQSLEGLWKQKSLEIKGAGLSSIDTLHTLVRLEVEIRKIENVSVYGWALASYKLAHVLGDKLYSALAKVDLLYSMGVVDLEGQLKNEMAEFKKIKMIVRELTDSSENGSTSVQCLRNYKLTEKDVSDLSPDTIESLVFMQKKIAISFSPLKIVDLEKRPTLQKACEVLALGKLTKENFFKQVWGLSQFHAHLHDNLIRTTLSNLRKTLSIEVKSQDGAIATDTTHWIVT